MLYSVAEGYDAARGVLPNNRLKYLNILIPTKSYKEYTMTISNKQSNHLVLLSGRIKRINNTYVKPVTDYVSVKICSKYFYYIKMDR